jgi:hypothetical protein
MKLIGLILRKGIPAIYCTKLHLPSEACAGELKLIKERVRNQMLVSLRGGGGELGNLKP